MWGEVAKIAVIRDKVAHNPLVTIHKTGEMGIIDVKKMKGIGPYEIEPLKPADIASAGKQLRVILEEIVKLLNIWVS